MFQFHAYISSWNILFILVENSFFQRDGSISRWSKSNILKYYSDRAHFDLFYDYGTRGLDLPDHAFGITSWILCDTPFLNLAVNLQMIFLCEIHQYEAATQNRRKTLCDPNKPDVYLTKGKLVNYIQACQTSWSIIRINIFRSINILYDSPLYEISYVHQTQTEPKRFGPNLVERIERLF